MIDGKFVPIAAVDRSPPDVKYLRGAIDWQIRGKVILSRRQVDLVDLLWAYLVDGLAEYHGRGRFETYFPDQPLRLAWGDLGGGKVEIEVGAGRHVVARRDLLDSIAFGGEKFFGWAARTLRGGTAFQTYLQAATRRQG